MKVIKSIESHWKKLKKNNLQPLLYLWILVTAYIIFNASTQYLVSTTADLDQAEQLIFSQDWLLGYTSQPPLYTWIVHCVFSITGPTFAALLGIKVALLSLFVAILIEIGSQFSFTMQQQLISVSSLAFIPQYIWQSQRDLTHSVLVTILAAATLFQAIKIQRNSKISNYIIFGLLIGMGLISKYNFAIFLVALFTTLGFTDQYRKVINNHQILMSVAVAILVITPHAFWVLSNIDIATGSVDRLNATANNHLQGLVNALVSALIFFTPLWIFSLILIKKNICRIKLIFISNRLWKLSYERDNCRSTFRIESTKSRMDQYRQSNQEFIAKLFLITIGLILIFILVTGTQEMRDRWYNPLFFFAPLLIALYSNSSHKKTRTYGSVALVVAFIVCIALPSRTLLAENVHYTSRPNIPYPMMAQTLGSSFDTVPVAIFAETKLIGGNFRPVFRNSHIITPDHDWLPLPHKGEGLILCETRNCQNDELRNWMTNKYGINLSLLKFNNMKSTYYYVPTKELVLYWAKFRF